MGKIIVLIGFRAVGKTTVGETLARALGYRFIDTDRSVEKQQGRSVQEIVAASGWETFRRHEKTALADLLAGSEVVVATGGGAVLHRDEMERLKERAIIIWLTADSDVLQKRIEAGNSTGMQRPPLTTGDSSEEIDQVLRERVPLYRRYADIEIDTAEIDVDTIVNEIMRCIDFRGKSDGRK